MKLKGSKTEKNLKDAFTRESEARNKYTQAAEIARKAGFKRVSQAFLEVAHNEREHARIELDFLKGTGNTEANLKAAITGEGEEATKLYPEFAKTARKEGFAAIADFFERAIKIEQEHQNMFDSLLTQLQKKKAPKRKEGAVWKCSSCGWIHKDPDAPSECPTCKAPTDAFSFRIDAAGIIGSGISDVEAYR